MAYSFEEMDAIARGAPSATPQQPSSSFAKNSVKARSLGDNLIIGALKGVGSTLTGIDTLVRKVPGVSTALDAISPKKGGLAQDKAVVTPKGTAQKVAFGAEQLAEFLVPGGAVAKGAKAAQGIKAVSKLAPAAQTAAKVATRAGLEAVSAGAVRTAQTGSVQEGMKAGAIAGGITGAAGAVGAGLKASGLPEKLYGQIFKSSFDDMTNALRTGGIKDLQAKFPEKFKEFADAGIIKVGKGGTVQFDPTLAREALDRGLRGSLPNMANESVRKTLELELTARKLAEGFKPQLRVPSPKKYVNIFRQLQEQYTGTFMEKRGRDAARLAKAFENGTVDAKTVLEARRFLDKMRIAASYRNDAKVSIPQEDFRKATDQLRGVLNKVPNMGGTMNNYRFYLEALEALAKEAQRQNNANVIGLIDAVLIGGGTGMVGIPAGLAAAVARRVTTMPAVSTGIAQKIEQGTKGNLGRAARGAIIKATTGKE
jgi:hypothetical protein